MRKYVEMKSRRGAGGKAEEEEEAHVQLDGLSFCLTGGGRGRDGSGNGCGCGYRGWWHLQPNSRQHEVAASCRKLSHFGVSTCTGREGGGVVIV